MNRRFSLFSLRLQPPTPLRELIKRKKRAEKTAEKGVGFVVEKGESLNPLRLQAFVAEEEGFEPP
jgi:hypothetical protein